MGRLQAALFVLWFMQKDTIPSPRKYLRTMNAADQTKLALIDQKVDYLVKGMDELKESVSENYATKAEISSLLMELTQLKERVDKHDKIIWSVIATVFLAIGGALMGVVLVHH
jgi:hypothetical protein